jgi:hypothetical protein
MSFSDLNYVAIIIAAVAGFAVGAVWYTFLFSKQWLAAVGLTEEQIRQGSRSPMPFIVAGVAQIVMAIILSAIVHAAGAATIGGGIVTGFLVWLGFVITVIAVNYGFANYKPMLTAIDGGHWLVVLVVMGAIIGAFG